MSEGVMSLVIEDALQCILQSLMRIPNGEGNTVRPQRPCRGLVHPLPNGASRCCVQNIRMISPDKVGYDGC